MPHLFLFCLLLLTSFSINTKTNPDTLFNDSTSTIIISSEKREIILLEKSAIVQKKETAQQPAKKNSKPKAGEIAVAGTLLLLMVGAIMLMR